jgi:hypothetical protein
MMAANGLHISAETKNTFTEWLRNISEDNVATGKLCRRLCKRCMLLLRAQTLIGGDESA